jgi:plasmid stabilization system protein ParE
MPSAPDGVDKSYELRYLPLFWDDLNSAVTYIATQLKNPAAAENLLDQTERAILEHAKRPAFGTVYRRSDGRQAYYWLPIGNYMVFYVVEGNAMEVRRFLLGSRDLTRMSL